MSSFLVRSTPKAKAMVESFFMLFSLNYNNKLFKYKQKFTAEYSYHNLKEKHPRGIPQYLVHGS